MGDGIYNKVLEENTCQRRKGSWTLGTQLGGGTMGQINTKSLPWFTGGAQVSWEGQIPRRQKWLFPRPQPQDPQFQRGFPTLTATAGTVDGKTSGPWFPRMFHLPGSYRQERNKMETMLLPEVPGRMGGGLVQTPPLRSEASSRTSWDKKQDESSHFPMNWINKKTVLNNGNLYHQSSSFHRHYLSRFKSIPLLPFLNYRRP